jgi:hypothetical protein
MKELNLEIVTDYRLKSLNKRTVLHTTHVGVDLLNYKYFKNHSLLESHTGIYKEINEYHTKFHKVGKTDLSMIPFIEECVHILGDGVVSNIGNLFTRRQLIEIAIDKNWTYRTTRDKVKNDLSKSDVFKDIIKTLKLSYV